jgi:hypothetical protein
MDIIGLLIQGTIVLVQSAVCISYGCRIGDKVEEIDSTLRKTSKIALMRIQRLELALYKPPMIHLPPAHQGSIAQEYSFSNRISPFPNSHPKEFV